MLPWEYQMVPFWEDCSSLPWHSEPCDIPTATQESPASALRFASHALIKLIANRRHKPETAGVF